MMTYLRFANNRRLEPAHPTHDIERGFRAEVHDPLWLLGRQWQMGEHQGEDASSPVQVYFQTTHHAIEDPITNLDPTVVPAEAIVEAELDDWWTPGRRIRLGMEASAATNRLPALDELKNSERSGFTDLLLDDLPAPYHHFNGQGYDGFKLYLAQDDLSLQTFFSTQVPANLTEDFWDSERFQYTTSFRAASTQLSLKEHTGGHVDWYSADADRPLPNPRIVENNLAFPSRLRYPGAPHPRWWQIEDASVDIGGFPPDRSHFATMLLIDLIMSHSDDWFIFPVNTQVGHIVTLHKVVVRDSFDEEWEISAPGELDPKDDWTMFATQGLNKRSIVVWPTAVTPLAGPKLEEVVLGRDENTNLVWAVERRLGGRDVLTPERAGPEATLPPGNVTSTTTPKQYEYVPNTEIYEHWQPYPLEIDEDGHRWFIQGRLADLSGAEPVLMPPATAKVLRNLTNEPLGYVHRIDPTTISSLGMQLERRYMLARDTKGNPVLWLQRHRQPLEAPPMLSLRRDVLQNSNTS